LKLSNEQSESANWRRTENTMDKRKITKSKTTLYKTCTHQTPVHSECKCWSHGGSI